MDIQSGILTLAFNHIVLPPKLPGQQDGETVTHDVDRELTRRLLESTKFFQETLDDEAVLAWNYIEKSLNACRLVKTDGFVNKTLLLDVFQEVELDTALIIHVAQQNASILVRQTQ